MLAAMAVVFVAELGDKTQLVALGLGARHRLLPVIVGVVGAYAATNLLSVVVGGLLGAAFPTRGVAIVGGLLFLVFAAWSLRPEGEPAVSADSPEPVAPAAGALEEPPTTSTAAVALSVALTMFVAELGDKTMLATGTLAAGGNPVLVWIGATVGIAASGLLGVLVGRVLGAQLPERVTRLGSALLFAVFGVGLVATNL